MQNYKVQLDVFEGPMDLLMHLIEKNKIDIYDIPMAVLTEQYLAYLAAMRDFDMEVASEFLVMASTLLYIKSRMMLPKTAIAAEEESEDPRRELLVRILEYQRYKKVSALLTDMAEQQSRCVARAPMPLPAKRLPPEHLSVEALWRAFQTLVVLRRELTIPEVIVAQEEYRVEAQMVRIMETLQTTRSLPFETLVDAPSRGALIANFLALLELIRRKYIVVRQDTLFSAIVISLREDGATWDAAHIGDTADVLE